MRACHEGTEWPRRHLGFVSSNRVQYQITSAKDKDYERMSLLSNGAWSPRWWPWAQAGVWTRLGARSRDSHPGADEGVQVLTRGPVHEAFAETVTFDPEPGIVVPKRPPAAIEELPPEQRLEGANVTWIPGYWAWDDERSDFLWVSGIWRNLPPGRQWVPGYWGQSGQGFQWTSGYWADAKESEVEYLPEPPATVEVGPNRAAPSADQTWLPGSWVWQQNRYAWRLVSGRPFSRIGFGSRPITSTHLAATSSSRATGITRSRGAACCLRRSISLRAPTHGPVSPTRPRR